MVNDCLYCLIASVCYLEGISYKDITIVFDDSIIEDENALIERGIKLYQAGTISLEKFMSKYLHYEESEVKEELEKIQNEKKIIQPEGLDFFGTDEKDKEGKEETDNKEDDNQQSE